MTPKFWIVIGAFFGAAGVAIGAYHAHGLREMIEKSESDSQKVDQRMANGATAVRYQMYHAFALMIVGMLGMRKRCAGFQVAGALFGLGSMGFSGGLYLMVFADNAIHWSIVPAGGILLLAGWVSLAVSAFCLPANGVVVASK